MIVARRSSARTSVRQAIIALYEPGAAHADLWCPLALDVVAALGAVNGFSLAVACANPVAAKEIAEELPAGVDLRLHAAGPAGAEPAARFFARDYIERGFERIIVVAADTLGLTARLLATASSVLATESPVIGIDPSGAPYLVGVSDAAFRNGDEATLAALAGFDNPARLEGVPGRRLERLPRLSGLAAEAVPGEVESRGRLLPRTSARLAERPV